MFLLGTGQSSTRGGSERLGRALFPVLEPASGIHFLPSRGSGGVWGENTRVHKKVRAKQRKKTPLVRRVQGEEGTGRKENDEYLWREGNWVWLREG